MTVHIIIFFLFLLLFLLGRRNVKKNFFLTISYLLISLYQKCFSGNGKKDRKKISVLLAQLYPTGNKNEITAEYYLSKAALLLAILFISNLFAVLLMAGGQAENSLIEGKYIKRNEYGKSKKIEELLLTVPGVMKDYKVQVPVSERLYTDEQARQFLKDGAASLPELILGENTSVDEVKSDLNFIKKIPQLPVQVVWQCKPFDIISDTGQILTEAEIDNEGTLVEVTASLTCQEQQLGETIYLTVFPADLNDQEKIKRQVAKELEYLDQNTRSAEKMELPGQVEGSELIWKTKNTNTGMLILLLGILAGVAIYYGKDKELEKSIEKRRRQMLMDYPEILSKMTLLLGAGMPVKRAWKQIVDEYQGHKEREQDIRYAYEEMLVTYYELSSGISELQAYERFGKRCRVQQYLKFSALLAQNIKKGSRGLGEIFAVESHSAFEERKNLAKKLGEEAGTKLLGPMFLMLLVVLIIITVPAFLSFYI